MSDDFETALNKAMGTVNPLAESRQRIAELEAERDSIRDKALEEAAQLAKNAGYGAWLAEEIRALKGTKP